MAARREPRELSSFSQTRRSRCGFAFLVSALQQARRSRSRSAPEVPTRREVYEFWFGGSDAAPEDIDD